MARFNYKAISKSGQIVSGVLTASSKGDASEALKQQALIPLDIDRSVQARKPLFSRWRRIGKAPNARELALFTRELAILIDAKIPLDRALATLSASQGAPHLGHLANSLRESVREGKAMSDAMASLPGAFPEYYIGLVRAGEGSGSLAVVFEQLAEMLEKSDALQANLRSALIYPTFVLGLTALSLVVLLIYVVPEFATFFSDDRASLPLTTRAVLTASEFMQSWGWALALAIAVVPLLIMQLKNLPASRLWLDAAIVRLPGIGGLVRTAEASRFCRTLGTVTKNGVELTQGMRLAAATMRNRSLATAVRKAEAPLAEGEGLAAPLSATGLLPPMALQLVEVGEESGRLADMLVRSADMLDTELERRIQTLMVLLTPLVTALLGIVVALVIGSILSAMLSSYDVIF